MIDAISRGRRPEGRPSSMSHGVAVMLLAAVLGGCAVTQPKPPQLDLPAPTATAEQNALLEKWWVAFDDAVDL